MTVDRDVPTTHAGKMPEENPKIPMSYSELRLRTSLKGVSESIEMPELFMNDM